MRFIAREKTQELLESLSAEAQVWAPRELNGSGGTVMFERWSPGDPIAFEGFSTLSAKDMVLPRTEKLFGFRYTAGTGNMLAEALEQGAGLPAQGKNEHLDIESPGPAEKKVLFGARACDAKALDVLDSLFNRDDGSAYEDPGYRARRAGLTVITLACTSCDDACFCSSFENGAAEKAGSDLIFYPVETGFLVEAVTARGEQILSGGEGTVATERLFEESGLQPPALAETARVEGIAELESLLPAIFADLEFWERSTAQCISCGFCTYSCPTCHCFNIHDEMRGDREGERLRSWDACMFHIYTQEASGHNPRPTAAHRYRNRINHKFSYFPENQGQILCTGCGRCIRGCPAGLDIREVMAAALARARERGSGEGLAGEAPGAGSA